MPGRRKRRGASGHVVEAGRRKMVGGQDDMITDLALDLAASVPVGGP
ncbi:hypothetical protein [Streptomyces sp. PD-S100-1]